LQLNNKKLPWSNRKQDLIDYAADRMGDALMSIVDGTMTVKDAFKAMASDIIRELYRVLVVQELVNAAKAYGKVAGWWADGGAFSGGSALPNANGNGFSGGNVIPFASGGVVGSPTTFGMSGGRTGLMGEAGPEAIMPLQRGPNGKLGVTVNGGDGGGVTVNQVINISTGVQQTVRAEIKSMMPQIADNAKAAVLDAKRRGGSYGGAF
jgi:lambda family phage tail tape measure protein